jgi:hypothetical protein
MFAATSNFGGTSVDPHMVKDVLTESYDAVKSIHDIDPLMEFDKVITKADVFGDYIKGLTEGLDSVSADFIRETANHVREKALLEATTFGTISPYQKLVFPLIRVYFPRLIAKEAVTLGTLDAPTVAKYFIKYVMKDKDGNVIGNIPNYSTDGSTVAIPATPQDLNYNGNLKDIAGVTTQASLNRDIKITQVIDADGNVTEVSVPALIDGGIYSNTITLGNGSTDILVGNVNYQTGEATVTSVNGNAKKVVFSGTISTEVNDMNRRAELVTEKVEINTVDKSLQTSWTIELEQDAKALLSIDIKSEMVAILGAQIATEIDAEVINDLVNIASTQHPNAVDSFSAQAPASYAFGTKSWHENVIPVINKISNIIYNDTNIGQGNVLLVNPVDATIFQSINGYTAMGTASNGDMALQGGAYEVGNINNKWKILTSPLVPQGKVPILLKSNNEKEAVYGLYYYQPLYMQPFPLGSVPSLTLKSRFAKQLIRKDGIGLLQLV